MSYDGVNNLNQLDVGFPLDSASPAELAAALREVKTVLKTVMLQSLKANGELRSIDGTQLSTGSVGEGNIQDGAVTLGKLSDDSVTTSNIADGAITAAKLASGSITELKYGAASIPTSAYKDSSIPLSALAATIGSTNLSSSASNDTNRAVGSDHIKTGAVTSEKVASLEVTKLSGGSSLSIAMRVSDSWAPVALTGALSYDAVNGFTITSPVTAICFGDAKSRGSAGGTTTANTWVTRDLGEISDPSNIATFSGNAFFLEPGNYVFFARVPACNVGKHQARLWKDDGDDETIALIGTSEVATGAGVQTFSVISGYLVVTDNSHTYEIQHWCESSNGTSDLGNPASSDNSDGLSGYQELYTTGTLIKL